MLQLRGVVVFFVFVVPFAVGIKDNGLRSQKDGRVFSLFSVVTFPNNDCSFAATTSDSAGNKGSCLTASECTSAGGTSDGNCAAGFGVCCKIVRNTCGSTVDKNVTYIEKGSSNSSTCTYKINPVQSDICQIRLDFVKFTTSVSTDGACGSSTNAVNDYVTVDGPTKKNGLNLCGSNAGQHIYIENGAQTSSFDLSFVTGTDTTTTRDWSIKVTQIECSNPSKAPADCLQYFTGASGNIKSFNYNSVMLQSLSYTVCIRDELGFCKIDFSASDTTPDGFKLGAGIAAAHNDACTKSGVIIPNVAAVPVVNLFCGDYLSTITGDTASSAVREPVTPFTLGVFSLPAAQTASTGFNIAYSQVPCS